MRGPVRLIEDAWALFTSRPGLLIAINLVPTVLIIAMNLFSNLVASPTTPAEIQTMMSPFIILLALFVIVISIISGAAMVNALASSERPTIFSAYRFGLSYFWPYTWLLLLVMLAVALGFVFLIIPGIIFMVWFMFSHFILLLEGKRGVSAIKASKVYVRGKFFPVLWRIVALMVGAVVVSTIFSFIVGVVSSTLSIDKETGKVFVDLIDIVITPIVVAYLYLMYVDVRAAYAPTDAPSAPAPTV